MLLFGDWRYFYKNYVDAIETLLDCNLLEEVQDAESVLLVLGIRLTGSIF